MHYLGGKVRVAKELSKFLNSKLEYQQPFVDIMCGAMNVVSHIDGNRERIANDINYYLMSMWKEMQNDAFIPPKTLTEEEYKYVQTHKDENSALTAFVGFGCSFSGKWFGGYARDNSGRNYCLNAYNATYKKLSKIMDVELYNVPYNELYIPPYSMIYIDPPYKNTTKYDAIDSMFDYEELYKYIKEKSREGHNVLCSEYKHNVPDGFDIVWEMESKKDMRNKRGVQEKTKEVLFTWRK